MATELFIVEIRARGANKVARQLKKINAAALAARKTMALFRNALVGIAAIRLFGGIIRQVAQFDNSMQTIKAIVGTTKEEFIKLEAEARKLGATTKFTASEAAEGMLALGRAGFSTTEILQASAHTLDLAIVGAIDLGKASEITAGTLRGFGLAAAQTERVVDIMTFTAQKSLNTISDLGESFKLTAPIAGQLGVSIEELASQFVILGQNNVRASLAGTALRRVMLNLESPGGTLLKTLKRLKIPLDEVRISSVGLSGAMKRLAKAGLGVSDAGQLFGLRGAVAFAIMSDLADDATEFKGALDGLRGTTKEAADIIEDSLLGALDRVRSAAEAVNLEFFRVQNNGFLREFFEGLATTLRFVVENMGEIITAFKLAGAAAIIGLVGLGKFANALAWIQLRVEALTLAIARNPIGALAVALTAAAVALIVFQDEAAASLDGTKTWADTWIAAGKTIDSIFGTGGTLEDASEEMSLWSRLVDGVSTLASNAFLFMLGVFSFIVESFKIRWDLLLQINRRGTLLLIDGFNAVAEAWNSTIGEIETFSIELINTDQLEKDIAKFEQTSASVTKRLFDAFNKPRDELDKAAAARRLLNAPSPPRVIIPEPKVNAPNKGGGTGEDTSGALKKEIQLRQQLRDALKNLEAAFFPVIAMREREKEIMNIIDDAREKGIKLIVNERELIKRAMRAHLGLGISLEQLEEQYKVLSVQRAKGVIDIEEEIKLTDKLTLNYLNNQTTMEAGIARFFLKRRMDAQDTAKQIETLLDNTWKAGEDALHEFVTTGKADFSSLADSIIDDITRMSLKFVASQIFSSLTGQAGGFGDSAHAPSLDGLTSFFTSIAGGLGFAHGGSFRVGSGSSIGSNLPGVDNRLVAFRARAGEEVHVTQKSDVQQNSGGGGGGGTTNIVFNVQSENADSFLRSQSQIQNKLMFAGTAATRRR